MASAGTGESQYSHRLTVADSFPRGCLYRQDHLSLFKRFPIVYVVVSSLWRKSPHPRVVEERGGVNNHEGYQCVPETLDSVENQGIGDNEVCSKVG